MIWIIAATVGWIIAIFLLGLLAFVARNFQKFTETLDDIIERNDNAWQKGCDELTENFQAEILTLDEKVVELVKQKAELREKLAIVENERAEVLQAGLELQLIATEHRENCLPRL